MDILCAQSQAGMQAADYQISLILSPVQIFFSIPIVRIRQACFLDEIPVF